MIDYEVNTYTQEASKHPHKHAQLDSYQLASSQQQEVATSLVGFLLYEDGVGWQSVHRSTYQGVCIVVNDTPLGTQSASIIVEDGDIGTISVISAQLSVFLDLLPVLRG